MGSDPSATQKWLVQVSAQFQDIYEKTILTPYREEIEAVRKEYQGAIEGALREASAAGKLKEAELLRQERERYFAGGRMVSIEAEPPPMLENARKVFYARLSALNKRRAEKVQPLCAKLDAALARNSMLLKQRQLLADAALLDAKREQITRDWLQPEVSIPGFKEKHENRPNLSYPDLKGALQWMLASGWRISISSGKKSVPLENQETIPAGRMIFDGVLLEPPAKKEIGEVDRTVIQDADLDRLVPLRKANRLTLVDHPFGDRAFAFLEEWRELKRFHLQGGSVSDRLAEKLARFPMLTEVSVPRCTRLTGQFVEDLARESPRLESLNVSNNPHFTDKWVDALLKFKDLESLDLHGTNLTDAGLARLVGLKRLTILDITNTKVTPAGIVSLSGLKLQKLYFLNTENPTFPAVATEMAVALPGIEHLELSGREFRVEHAAALARFRHLRALALRNAVPETGALVALRDVRSLEKLQCWTNGFGDNQAAEVVELKQVEMLDLRHTGITDEGFMKLARHKGLKVVDVCETAVTEAAVERLGRVVHGLRVKH